MFKIPVIKVCCKIAQFRSLPHQSELTHWGQVMHICISTLTIIGSDNGLLPGWCQAIIWTITGILLIAPLGTNFNEILVEIYTFLFREMHSKISSGKWWQFYLGLNVLTPHIRVHVIMDGQLSCNKHILYLAVVFSDKFLHCMPLCWTKTCQSSLLILINFCQLNIYRR